MSQAHKGSELYTKGNTHQVPSAGTKYFNFISDETGIDNTDSLIYPVPSGEYLITGNGLMVTQPSGNLIYSTPAKFPMTISIDYYVDNVVTNSDRYLFSYDNNDNTDMAFSLCLTREDKWRMYFGVSYDATTKFEYPNTLSTGFHTFTIRASTSTATLFIDGLPVGSISTPAIASSLSYLRVGNGNSINLVANGHAQSGNNSNFTTMQYATGADSYDGDGKYFIASGGSMTILSNDFIPVDINRRYAVSAAFKYNSATNGQSRYYYGVACYDKDKLYIDYSMCTYTLGTQTTLAAPLNNGDTTVKLNSTASWYTASPGTYVHQKQISFWNTGAYPDYTYTRTVGRYIDINVAGTNTLTLQSAWAGGMIPSGTAVANSLDGSSYTYTAASNALTTDTWTLRSGNIGGGQGMGSNASIFRYGTKYIKIMSLINRESTPTVTRTMVDAIRFIEHNSTADCPIRNLYVCNELLSDDDIYIRSNSYSLYKHNDYRGYAY